ncbi:MAG TPA: ROK family protein [Holophagaceae bacterium]|nr:ROK family protein [Holophagaceae bacterium]
MRFAQDPRTVLTLDAGGTTFTFSALRGGTEVMTPFTVPAHGDDLERCLAQMTEGFERARREAGACQAISFAFPGPADYGRGIIGDLGNLPGFRGGVPLGPLLEARFGCPVFINNDGDLFAYGEALGGFLPEVNAALEAAGAARRHRNLIGLTFGTGFGGGLVRDGRLVVGDNGAAGEVWLLRHRDERDLFAEEGVSIRAVRLVYGAAAGLDPQDVPEPKVLADIARGHAPGHREAAREAFRRLGQVAGDALAEALTLFDGLAVIGGGLSGAADLFMPALVGELNGHLRGLDGSRVSRLELQAHHWEDRADREAFLGSRIVLLSVPGTDRQVPYDPVKRTAVGLSRLGTSRAVGLGAWAFALDQLDRA